MCGITGLFALKAAANPRLSKVAAANDRLYSRGPDSGAVYTGAHIALGHRRLSIIDTSSCGAQPMEDISHRYVIVFNGEIFNYNELARQHLKTVWERIGGPVSHSDTEVLLYLLIEYNVKCLEWLSGFFAFAFWDKELGELLLARDRYGKKPLHYYACDEYIAFGSEMKALFEWDIPRKINIDALHQYLRLNYVPTPLSMIAGVLKLRPAHYMRIGAKGITAYEAYYTLRPQPQAYSKLSYIAAQKELVKKMDASVQERMIADVPIGAFLSGGIDSSVIVALAAQHTGKLRTFSVGYKDNSFFDETKYAQLVADKYKTDHTVFLLANKDFLAHLYDVLNYIDEPFADPSAIPFYILSKETKKHVTVALSGDGGDEVFAGYNKHAAEWRIRRRSPLNALIKAGHPIWRALPKSRNSKLGNTFRQLNRFAEGAGLDQKERYWRWATIATEDDIATLVQPQYAAANNAFQAEALAGLATGDFNEVLLTDMNLVLPGDMLVKADLMSMAASLEVRSPFLDYKVVDFAFSLPPEYKINGRMKKRIVQDAFRSMLPEEIYNRPKQGFDIPMLDWFRTELKTFIFDDLLCESFVQEQGIFRMDGIEAIKRQLFSSSPGDIAERIWALVVFQYWYKKYML